MKKIALFGVVILVLYVILTLNISGCALLIGSFKSSSSSSSSSAGAYSLTGVWQLESVGTNSEAQFPVSASGESIMLVFDSDYSFFGGYSGGTGGNGNSTVFGYWEQTSGPDKVHIFDSDSGQTNEQLGYSTISNGKLVLQTVENNQTIFRVFSKSINTVSGSDPAIGVWHLISIELPNGTQSNAQTSGISQMLSMRNDGTFYGGKADSGGTGNFAGKWSQSAGSYNSTVYGGFGSNVMSVSGFYSNNYLIMVSPDPSYGVLTNTFTKSINVVSGSDPIIGAWKLIKVGSQTAQAAQWSQVVSFKSNGSFYFGAANPQNSTGVGEWTQTSSGNYSFTVYMNSVSSNNASNTTGTLSGNSLIIQDSSNGNLIFTKL